MALGGVAAVVVTLAVLLAAAGFGVGRLASSPARALGATRTLSYDRMRIDIPIGWVALVSLVCMVPIIHLLVKFAGTVCFAGHCPTRRRAMVAE